MPPPSTPIGPPAATVLAAGWGRRLGGVPKAALEIAGRSLLERLADALRAAGVNDIGVVLGPYADTLVPLAQRAGAQVIAHTRPQATRVQSQRLAVAHHVQHRHGQDLMLLVADLPWLTGEDVAELIDAWSARTPGQLAQVPLFDGARGHPVVLSWTAVQAIAAQPADQGVRNWMDRANAAVRCVRCERPGPVRDLDTPEDFDALRRAFAPHTVQWPPARPHDRGD